MQLAGVATAFKSLINDVYTNTDDDMPSSVFESINNELSAPIQGIDAQRTAMLTGNVARMSAAKAYSLKSQLEDAKATNKKAYEASAKEIAKTHARHLAAEKAAAIHRARVVKQWTAFEQEKHLYPNIEWIRTRSAKADKIHLQFAGRVWAGNDQFWHTNQPGCRYGCKCSWKSTDTPPSNNGAMSGADTATPGLEGNPYYTGEIFSDTHPYIVNTPNHVPPLGPLHLPDKQAFIPQRTKSGTAFTAHYNALSEHEYAGNAAMVDALAEAGYKDIRLLPRIDAKETALRTRYYGKGFHSSKCPDAMADGKSVEFKVAGLRNKSRRINEASDKSEVVVLDLIGDISDKEITLFGERTMKLQNTIKQLIIHHESKLFVF